MASNQAHDQPLARIFTDLLQEIYYAEKRLLTALQAMVGAAQDPELKAGIEQHFGQSKSHILRLEQIFEMLGLPARGKTCEAALGLLEESSQIIVEYRGTHALDPGLIGISEAIEHYEIARYNTLKTWAEELGRTDAAHLLDATSREEAAMERMLSGLSVIADGGDGLARAAPNLSSGAA